MINRRAFLSLLALWSLASLRQSGAQQDKVSRIGLLNQKPQPKVYYDFFIEAMRSLGYVEGQNLLVQYNYGTPQELPALASDFVRLNIDLIVCGGSAAVRSVMGATRTIPVVAVDLETDPIARGFASSLAHPGGNLTGFFLDLPEFSAKRLEIIKETLPTVTRVMVLWDPSLERGPLDGLKSAARALNLSVKIVEVKNELALRAAFKAAGEQKMGAAMVMQSPTLDAYASEILKLGAQYRVPIMALFANFTVGGALLSYGPNIEDLTGRMSVYVDKILKGAKPGDLPIERPAKFDFVVNLHTAKVLGLKIPRSILARADQLVR